MTKKILALILSATIVMTMTLSMPVSAATVSDDVVSSEKEIITSVTEPETEPEIEPVTEVVEPETEPEIEPVTEVVELETELVTKPVTKTDEEHLFECSPELESFKKELEAKNDKYDDLAPKGGTLSVGSGSCGTNATYTFDAKGTLTISGTGAISMSSFNATTNIISVIINEGITSIDNGVFSLCSRITSVQLPSTLTSIGQSAFEGCSALTTVSFPKGNYLTSIGDAAFRQTSISDFTIPSTLVTIGKEAFFGCRYLGKFSFPKPTDSALTSIGELAFYASGIAGSHQLSNSLTSLGNGAFMNCTSLTSVTLPNSLTSIGGATFTGCTSLSSVTLPNALTSIPVSMFEGCTSLNSISIPGTVTSIEASAFYGCTSLGSRVGIPASVKSIGTRAFLGCTNLYTLTFATGSECETIGARCFAGCPLSSITVPEAFTGSPDAFKGAISISQETGEVNDIPAPTPTMIYWNCYEPVLDNIGDQLTLSDLFDTSRLGTLTLGVNVKRLPEYFAENITTLGRLGYVSGSSVLKEIPNRAFAGCTSLVSPGLPASVTIISNSAFEGCSGIISISLSASLTTIGNSAFAGCEQLGRITLPDSVTTIGDSAFAGTGLTDITLSASLTTIGGYAFASTALTSVTIPKYVTSIGNDAFVTCPNLKTFDFELGSYCSTIGNSVLGGCTSLETITVPEAFAGGEMAFMGNILVAAPTPTTINWRSRNPLADTAGSDLKLSDLFDTSALTTVNVGAEVESLPESFAQGKTTLAEVNFAPNSVLTEISVSAFASCTSLTSITLPDSVTTIGNDAFGGCRGITSITLPSSLTTIGANAFVSCQGITSITLPSSLTTIGNAAFNATGLKSITIPKSVTSIGSFVFGRTSLETLDFELGSNCTTIGDEIFNGALQTVTLPEVLTTATANAFGHSQATTVNWRCREPITGADGVALTLSDLFDTSALTTVNVGAEVKSLPEGFARGIVTLKTANLVRNTTLTELGRYAFYGCTELENVTLPKSLKNVSHWAFENCTKLSNIIIPEGVTYICYRAFYNSGLMTLVIPSTVTNLHDNLIGGANANASIYFKGNKPTMYSAGGDNGKVYSFPVTSKIYYPLGNTTWERGGGMVYNSTDDSFRLNNVNGTPVVTNALVFEGANNVNYINFLRPGETYNINVPQIPSVENKLIMGWYDTKTDKPAKTLYTLSEKHTNTSVAEGVVFASETPLMQAFEPKYLTIGTVTQDTNDTKNIANDTYREFELAGVQIRTGTNEGVRFVTCLSESLLGQLKGLHNSVEYGYVIGTKRIIDQNIGTGTELVKGITGTETVDCTKLDRQSDHKNFTDYRLYTLVVKYTADEKITRGDLDLVTRAYITYTDANGVERTFYSDYDGSSVEYKGCCISYNDALALPIMQNQ